MSRIIASLLVLAPSLSFAAGLTFGENGSKAFSMGGAFVGQADDLTAVQFNPAGLAQQQGYQFLVDIQFLNNEVTFQQTFPGTDPRSTRPPSDLARNSGGVFLLPFAAGSANFTLLDRSLTVGAGLYAPPTVGRYSFNEPNYAKHDANSGGRPGTYIQNPTKYAAQRYALIGTDNIILLPGLSVGYQVHRTVSVGASLQYVVSSFHFAQTITTSDALGNVNDNPDLDAQVIVDMRGKGGFTGNFGVLVSPNDMIQIGASVRPPITIQGTGTMKIQLGELAGSTASVTGESADLQLVLPLEIRGGVHVRPIPQVGVNADVVFERWRSFREITLTPIDIYQQVGNAEPKKLGQLHIPKRWDNTLSVRGGASYRFNFPLEVRAGVMWEQQAAPAEYFNIDFPHPQRVFITGGASYDLGPTELVLGGAYTPTQTLVIENSDVRQVTSDAAVPGLTVGNGTYTSGGWSLMLGVRGRFGAPLRAP